MIQLLVFSNILGRNYLNLINLLEVTEEITNHMKENNLCIVHYDIIVTHSQTD